MKPRMANALPLVIPIAVCGSVGALLGADIGYSDAPSYFGRAFNAVYYGLVGLVLGALAGVAPGLALFFWRRR